MHVNVNILRMLHYSCYHICIRVPGYGDSAFYNCMCQQMCVRYVLFGHLH